MVSLNERYFAQICPITSNWAVSRILGVMSYIHSRMLGVMSYIHSRILGAMSYTHLHISCIIYKLHFDASHVHTTYGS
jgi:hypothetical protein